MTLDYVEMIKLVRVRKKQIEDVSLELDVFNKEFVVLGNIEKQLAELIVNERKLERV